MFFLCPLVKLHHQSLRLASLSSAKDAFFKIINLDSLPYLKSKRYIHNCSFSQFSFSSKAKNHSTASKKPPTAPKLNVKWFYATDIPISKPARFKYTKQKDAEVFIPFSEEDSKKLENTFKALQTGSATSASSKVVEVNEDHLFQVDLETLQLSPIYWEGPIYEVRRGIWFDTNGVPLDYELATAIEKGYQQCKPYLPKDAERKKDLLEFSNSKANGELSVSEQDDIVHISDTKSVLYVDEKTSHILPESMNKFQLGVIRNFSNGPLIGVKKITRGYTKEVEDNFLNKIENPLPDLADVFQREITSLFTSLPEEKTSVTDSNSKGNDDIQNRHFKQELENDYNKNFNNEREIEHLVFCVHGIGQVLGAKYDSINFTHSCNVFRKTLKEVFKQDVRYHKLAYPDETFDPEDENYSKEKHNDIKSNCKVQVLPISWRHKVDFSPNVHFEEYDSDGEYRLPTLADVTVDGVKPIRNLVGEVAFDILLYYEPEYLKVILTEVTKEINRVFGLYVKKNPSFKGKVHILGHSLGSVISFDILSRQPNETVKDENQIENLHFEVDKFFAVGSPVGAFKLLQKTNLGPRSLNSHCSKKAKIDAPKVNDFYNIFHPCDPVGYRMEPLINIEYSKLNPRQVPFALKGLNTQIKDLADFGGEFGQKVVAKASQAWQLTGSPSNKDKNPLKSIVSSIAENSSDGEKNTVLLGEDAKVSSKALNIMKNCNKTGRVDYALPMGVFDISLVSAISAHVSYFEDQDTAGFILSQLLSKDSSAENRK